MYKSGKTPIDDQRRLNRSLILGISETTLVGLMFYLGFVLTSLWNRSPKSPYLAQGEIIMMSVGAAFSYAFVFVFRLSRQSEPEPFSRPLASTLFGKLSQAYLLQLAILFLVKDSGFSSVRNAIGLGFLLGYFSILANSFLMSFLYGSDKIREGKKKFILKGMKSVTSGKNGKVGEDTIPREFEVSRRMSADEILGRLDGVRGHKANVAADHQNTSGAIIANEPDPISRVKQSEFLHHE